MIFLLFRLTVQVCMPEIHRSTLSHLSLLRAILSLHVIDGLQGENDLRGDITVILHR